MGLDMAKRPRGSRAGREAALSTGSSRPPAGTSLDLTVTVTEPPVTVVPTPYPADPTAQLVVPDYLRVDPKSEEFREFNKRLDKIIVLLSKSNAIAGDTRQQLIAEIKAGRELLASPRPNRVLVALLLERPLSLSLRPPQLASSQTKLFKLFIIFSTCSKRASLFNIFPRILF
jgi:hypothetical protein